MHGKFNGKAWIRMSTLLNSHLYPVTFHRVLKKQTISQDYDLFSDKAKVMKFSGDELLIRNQPFFNNYFLKVKYEGPSTRNETKRNINTLHHLLIHLASL